MFGWFGGDKKLAAQKAALAACVAQFEVLDRSLVALPALRADFAAVWPAEGPPDQLLARIDTARELVQLLDRRAATARRVLENFDDALALAEHNVPIFIEEWAAFVGLLVARQAIATGEGTKIRVAGEPSVFQCQQALLDLAEGLFANLRVQIDELSEVRPRFQGPWPEPLDLPRMEAGMLDTGKALEIYRGRLGEGEELPCLATRAMFEMILRLESRLAEIEHWRPQLAMHTLMSGFMRNLG